MSEPLCNPELLWTLRNKQKRWNDCFREEGEGEMYAESNMEIYNTICKIDSQWESAIWLMELKQGLSDKSRRDGEGDGKEVQEGGNMGVPMANSYWCIDRNPQNSVKQLSFNYKNKLKTKQKKHSLPFYQGGCLSSTMPNIPSHSSQWKTGLVILTGEHQKWSKLSIIWGM